MLAYFTPEYDITELIPFELHVCVCVCVQVHVRADMNVSTLVQTYTCMYGHLPGKHSDKYRIKKNYLDRMYEKKTPVMTVMWGNSNTDPVLDDVTTNISVCCLLSICWVFIRSILLSIVYNYCITFLQVVYCC